MEIFNGLNTIIVGAHLSQIGFINMQMRVQCERISVC